MGPEPTTSPINTGRKTSGWLQNVTDENTYHNYRSRHDVPLLRHMTSNKTYDFCMFSKFVNFVLIDLKIGTHIDWTYIM